MASSRMPRLKLGSEGVAHLRHHRCRAVLQREGCGFYETGPQFVTILRRQRDDAAAHTDPVRARLYDQLIRVIDETDDQRGENLSCA